ncbi:MAG: Gfo/Idh/MocA family oxidoreductase [Acidobacteriota bacterium]|nr:Gfo/Idh/MocA family oxidoreductase [Acidobacteriota bacterium]
MSAQHSETDIGILSEEQIRMASKRPQAHDRKARLGLIGAGWWATTNHLPLLKARGDVEIASICSLDEETNARIQRDFAVPHVTTDYRQLLSQKLDGVVVSSPHSLHAKHALAAVDAGCHVMVEKPMTTSTTDARRLVSESRKKGLHVLVPYGWNYRPLSARAKTLMEQQIVGKIEFVLCHMASPTKSLFAGRSFDYPEGSYVAPDLSTWSDPAVSHGGYGQGQLSHALGLLTFLCGLRPKSVFARMSNPDSRVDMYDSLSISFYDGVIGSVSGAATVPAGAGFQLDIRIFGSRGVLLFDVERERLECHTHEGVHRSESVTAGDGAYRCDEPPHQFVELILGLTDQNNSPGEVALRAVEITDAAYRSSQTGVDELV